MPQLDNFFNNPTILKLYYENLRDLLGTVFSKERFDAFVINSLDWLPEESDVVEDVISFMDERRALLIDKFPMSSVLRAIFPIVTALLERLIQGSLVSREL